MPVTTEECACGYDGDWTACCNGAVYGRCEDEHCGGACEFKAYCECPCHDPKEQP